MQYFVQRNCGHKTTCALIQHCKGNRQYFANLLNTVTFTACLYNDYVDLTFIINFYEKYDWQIEIEAYCLENVIYVILTLTGGS